MSDTKVENVIIIGSGPAGYTAALYTARADLEPLVIEGFIWGGLLQQTTDVENYPGYPDGVMGPEMMQQFRDQAERFGARFVSEDVTRVELARDGGVHRVFVGDDEHRARAVVLAMGATPKKLGVAGEEELSARGVSYCATCDAAFFRDKPTIVVGGGDTAMEDAIFLSKFACDVKVVHRRDEFRASAIMLDRARAQPNIELLTPYTVDRFEDGGAGSDGGPGQLSRAVLTHADGGDDVELDIDGAFIAIGHEPNSDIVAGQVEVDEERLRAHRGQVHPDEPDGRVRGRRPRRSHLPPGGHRRGQWLSGRARRGVVPPRRGAGRGGALDAGARQGRARGGGGGCGEVAGLVARAPWRAGPVALRRPRAGPGIDWRAWSLTAPSLGCDMAGRNRDQRERLRDERQEREQSARSAQRRKRLVGYGAAAVLCAAAVAALLIALTTGGGDGGATAPAEFPPGGSVPLVETTELEEAARKSDCELKTPPNEGDAHVEAGTELDFESNPPTSGAHYFEPAAEMAYTEAPPIGNLVHALEHGRIYIQYAPDLPDDEIADLKALYDQDPFHRIIAPNTTDMPYEVAATTWDHLLACRQLNDEVFDAIRTFTDEYRDVASAEGYIP